MVRNKWKYKKVRIGGKESIYNIDTININKMTDSQIAEINGNLEGIEKNILARVEELLPTGKEREEFKEAVVAAIMTKFEEKIMPKFDEISGIKTAVDALKENLVEWQNNFDNRYTNLENEIKKVVVAGQEAQGKDLKELLKNKEKQDEINRRLDLYMTSTEAAIAENTMQLKNVEKMLLLKEEKDRKNFDAIKEGLKGLAGDTEEIKGKIGGLLKEETAFQEFQKLWDHNNYIKQQNDYIKTLLINLADNVYKQDEDKKNKIDKINSVIRNLEDKLTTLNDSIKNAIAKSDAKLLGMIMPEIANLKDQNDQILINQETQTTILNSILSGQQNNALQYVAMSEKLDNLTELVSALSTRTTDQGFAEQANTLLENFAKSQKAAFAKVAEKDDLKHLDTGIDSIINMLSDNSITLEMMNKEINSMASQINVVAIDIKRVLEILSQTRTALDNVADCDRCHSADSMFYKCQVCGIEGHTDDATPNTSQIQDKRPIQWWNKDRKILTLISSKIHVKNAAGESEIKYIIYISDFDASNDSNIIIGAGMKYDNNDVETIIFEACDLRNSGQELDCQTKEGCNIEKIFIELNRPRSGYKKNNIWEYFPNLKTISFAKPMDGKWKYVLGTKLLYINDSNKNKIKLLDEMKFYGGKYITGMEKSVCYLEEEVRKTFLVDRLDKNKGGLLDRIRKQADSLGKGFWRQKIEEK